MIKKIPVDENMWNLRCAHIKFSIKQLNKRTFSNIFDRKAKTLQRSRSALNIEKHKCNYLKREIGFRLTERLADIDRNFETVVDLGCGLGFIASHLSKEFVQTLILIDGSEYCLNETFIPKDINTRKLLMDEENLELDNNSVDLLMSCLSFHWVNDLPRLFHNILKCLKADGILLAAMLGGNTLKELRYALLLADLEQKGGLSPHVSPFIEGQDIGSLLQTAGFTLITVDLDEITVNYPSMFELMFDLQVIGENNAIWNRPSHIGKNVLISAAAIYHEKTVPATFQVYYMIAWKPHSSQPVPAPRGSGTISLKDLGQIRDKFDFTHH